MKTFMIPRFYNTDTMPPDESKLMYSHVVTGIFLLNSRAPL